jgi:hypothetical protein
LLRWYHSTGIDIRFIDVDTLPVEVAEMPSCRLNTSLHTEVAERPFVSLDFVTKFTLLLK